MVSLNLMSNLIRYVTMLSEKNWKKGMHPLSPITQILNIGYLMSEWRSLGMHSTLP